MSGEIALGVIPILDAGDSRFQSLTVLVAQHEFAGLDQVAMLRRLTCETFHRRLRNSVTKAKRLTLIIALVTSILPVNKLEANIRRDNRIEFARAGKIPDAIFAVAIEQSQ